MHVDIHCVTASCDPTNLTSWWDIFTTPSSFLMMSFKAFSCHVIVIPFHRSPRKRYMQYFYQQFRLCHRDNYGEFLCHFGWFLQCVNVLSVPQPAGPPVNVTCNIFINSFGSIAETTMVSQELISAQELRMHHTVFFFFFSPYLPNPPLKE